MVRTVLLLFGLCAIVSLTARAQDRAALFGGYSYIRFLSTNLNGWEVSGQYKVSVRPSGCQIMRRMFETLANEAGGDLKDIQTQMRHSRSATTADIYVQPIPRSVQESMELSDRVLSDRPGQPPPKTEEDKFVQ
jgi:integrase